MAKWQRMLHYFRTCSVVEWEVWDRPTRFFHWSVTGLLVADLITGWLDPAWQLDRHLLLGGVTAGLLMFRLLWGVVGSEYNRFSHYFQSPAQVYDDARALWRGQTKSSSLALNPVNAWVSLLLLLIVFALLVTGLVAYGGEEHMGPLASLVSYSAGTYGQSLHEKLAVLLLVVVAIHIGIVRRESQLTRVSLLRSMVTGCKPMDVDQPTEQMRNANVAWAMVLGMVLMFSIDHTSKALGQLPMDGWRPLHYPVAYQEKCGHCHWTIHPSLLPEEAWQNLLSHMHDHFGHSVTLNGKEAVTITSFLLVHAAEDWNTDAAHRFRKLMPDPDQRITNHPAWQKIHLNIEAAVFDRPPVSSPINCPVCHHDALSGRFDEHAIHIPKATAASHSPLQDEIPSAPRQ
ncbi:MAG: cytochrome b/b6 domain-containing protein [Magnetococcales bacterium]|nr:cytochrome b/b6 domain-containing protein [Magnetococcales bacterium]